MLKKKKKFKLLKSFKFDKEYFLLHTNIEHTRFDIEAMESKC